MTRPTEVSDHLESQSSPLQHIKEIAERNDWQYDESRSEYCDGITVAIPENMMLEAFWSSAGARVCFVLRDDDLIAKPEILDAVYKGLALVNERTSLGFFSIDEMDLGIFFRYSVPSENIPDETMYEIIEQTLELMVREYSDFYPVFQPILAGSPIPEAALDIALLQVEGEA